MWPAGCRGLPVLDIALWRAEPAAFAAKLRHACHHEGFFQLKHGLPTALVARVVAEARSFFARDADQKAAIDYSRSPAFRGYMACGVENTDGKPDLREQVEIAAETPAAKQLRTRRSAPRLPPTADRNPEAKRGAPLSKPTAAL